MIATDAQGILDRVSGRGELSCANTTPLVWNTGEDNFASQRVAQKLGFAEVGRRMYVIVEG